MICRCSLGSRTQTVTVTGEVPLVNTTSATLGTTVENATIVDLPLNGRAFQKLLDFSPGMQQIPGGGTPAYNVNGQRGTNITWMLDGVDEINMAGGAGPTVGGNGGGVDGVTILSLDAIQELNTIQSPKAEYGWMAGSVVNFGLKSGTNNVHGTAFAFSAMALSMHERLPLLRALKGQRQPQAVRRHGRRPNQEGQALLLWRLTRETAIR